ncbi:polygalacturonase non-catalytic [Salix suchowensis]|nr:polygalacturonase non-catalytic [Salix suchowensis]
MSSQSLAPLKVETHHRFLAAFFFFLDCFGFGDSANGESPFTAKASLIRYWNKEIHTGLPKSAFLLSKASPLSPVDLAKFSKLASQNALSDQLPAFCSSAKLFCFPDLSPSLEKHDQDSHFAIYVTKNFTNYGSGRAGGADSFKNYSDGINIPVDSFRRYGRGAAGHDETFSNYAPEANVGDQSFNTYGAGATGGTGEFKGYNVRINNPNLRFVSYSDAANGKGQKFSTYTEDANAGDEAFTSYGKNGNGVPNEFSGYGTSSNVIGSDFSNYGETGNGANDTFKAYGVDGNVPQNNYKNYGDGGNGGVDSFANYREKSNVGDDSFQSYAKNSNAQKVDFVNYGKSFNEGTDKFTGYGKGATGQQIGFKIYGVNNTFKEYARKKDVTFSKYTNAADASDDSSVNTNKGKIPMLKKGSEMPMPDIRDKMPRRSFLPRPIISKLPFSSSKMGLIKETFHASDNSSMERIILDAVEECERAPSPGETKRCVGSAEDMIDFAISVLGRNVAVRTTENVEGSNKNVMIGSIKGINGGRVTKSVSCHQSLYPYLLYYCHSVPKVRVYEADLLDPKNKTKINRGVAICHLDTSSWSPTHGAFLALGSGPGRIEVCHWIFENDMTWTIADAS